jgi:hypothetical protein
VPRPRRRLREERALARPPHRQQPVRRAQRVKGGGLRAGRARRVRGVSAAGWRRDEDVSDSASASSWARQRTASQSEDSMPPTSVRVSACDGGGRALHDETHGGVLLCHVGRPVSFSRWRGVARTRRHSTRGARASGRRLLREHMCATASHRSKISGKSCAMHTRRPVARAQLSASYIDGCVHGRA